MGAEKDFVSMDGRFADSLLDLFPDEVVGVEVGVHLATHSCRMLENHPKLLLTCVDMWDLHAKQKSQYLNTRDIDKTAEAMCDIRKAKDKYLRALENLSPFHDRVNVIKDSSANASEGFDNGSLDFVYLDGDHSYEGCKSDIDSWLPKIKSGGILAGHDYFQTNWDGVVQAVDELVSEHNLELFAKNRAMCCCWLVRVN